MAKAGKNSAGKQRYKCHFCKARQVIKKAKSVKKNELKLFVKWITDSTKAFDKIKLSRMTFYRKIKWCWDIAPQMPQNTF
jgi:transposase-like protein